MRKFLLIGAAAAFALSGCTTKGDQYRGDVYSTSGVNQQQSVQSIYITNVLPAQVAVDNSSNKNMAQVAGGVLGATAGAIIGYNITGHSSEKGAAAGAAIGGVAGAAAASQVGDTTLNEGVTLVYNLGGQTYSSTQVGRSCEYRTGNATMITTYSGETRIQPNSTCAN